jgi:amino acid transporter
MMDTPNQEWNDWQNAWRAGPPSAPTVTDPGLIAALQRRIARHRTAAWAYTVLDGCATIALCGLGVYVLRRSQTLPVLVWTVSLFVFSAVMLGFAIWNRRDALVFTQPTADFLAVLRVRQDRRERVPRFLALFVAAETAFGLVFFVIWSPGSLARAAAIYSVVAAALMLWSRWYRARLRRARAQLDALWRASAAESSPQSART